jgi:porphobilinogen synthase
MLFGVPEHKDARGSGGTQPSGILNLALSRVREAVGDATLVMADTCLDEFTDHGHCGVLAARGRVDNDATLEIYGEMAVAQARAGAHVVGPSGMMDGQVGVIREALDASGFEETIILAYATKYASAFYGPFRDAVQSSLEGDRRTYQQDPANLRESLREIDLDVVAAATARTTLPVAAYQVSGEYAMIEAAAANGWIDRRAAALEALVSIRRAGAQSVLTYHALEAADWLS